MAPQILIIYISFVKILSLDISTAISDSYIFFKYLHFDLLFGKYVLNYR